MPTENRSSNTEMVSDLLPCPFCGEKPQITKHHREDIYSFMHRCPVLGPISWGFREDPQAHVEKWNARAKPAEQHQGEPLGWVRPEALEAFRDVGWVHVFAAKGGDDSAVAVYTRADPGEVERLRDELEIVKNNDLKWQGLREQEAEIENLRTQLAERDALLREAMKRINVNQNHGFVLAIDAALSATAEPSAPVAPYPNRLCHIDYTAHPYQCGCLKGDEEAQRRYDEHCRAASAAPEAKS